MKKFLIIIDIILFLLLVLSGVYIFINNNEDIQIDTILINYQEKIVTNKGVPVDLLDSFEIIDSNKDNYIVEIEGDYSFDEIGSYSLEYVIKKDNKEIDRKKLMLEVMDIIVEEKEEVSVSNSNENNVSNEDITSDEVVPTYINGILIVNKTYPLPRNFGNGITSEVMSAFNVMKTDAYNQGIYIDIISGFRSYDIQESIYNNYVRRDGVSLADTYSARAGHSEHQSGLAFDLNSLDTSFGSSMEGIWLNNNAYKYGFILRYPYGKTDETGYMYEPWHFRYVGVDLATTLYNNGDWITLEDYFDISSVYQ